MKYIKSYKLHNISERRVSWSISELENYLKLLHIEFTQLSYLGCGDFGEAYSLGNDKVVKITTSRSEYDIALQLLNKKLPGLIKFYEAKPIGNNFRYLLIGDEVDTDYSIGDDLYRVELILSTQGLSIEDIGNFDERDYDNSEGDLDSHIVKFMDELDTIFRSCRNLDIRQPDINYGNLGYDKNGVLTAFDLHDKKAIYN